MDNVNIGSKETDKKNAVPLSDEQLERAAGGESPIFAKRWVCQICGAHCHWSIDDGIVETEKEMHFQLTGHYSFAIFSKNLYDTFDPD